MAKSTKKEQTAPNVEAAGEDVEKLPVTDEPAPTELDTPVVEVPAISIEEVVEAINAEGKYKVVIRETGDETVFDVFQNGVLSIVGMTYDGLDKL